jgi:hypothetical protein
MTERQTFLLEMYKKMWDNIDRHIIVVWQSVGVLAGALATFAIADQKNMFFVLDYATAFVVLTAAWQLAHVFDANFWYNRNLLIVANIERQFLEPKDVQEIHLYFQKHRDSSDMLGHLKVQRFFGLAVLVLVLIRHLALRVCPGIGSPWSNFEWQRSLPYLAVVGGGWFLYKLTKQQRDSYDKLKTSSPGREMATPQSVIEQTIPKETSSSQ